MQSPPDCSGLHAAALLLRSRNFEWIIVNFIIHVMMLCIDERCLLSILLSKNVYTVV